MKYAFLIVDFMIFYLIMLVGIYPVFASIHVENWGRAIFTVYEVPIIPAGSQINYGIHLSRWREP